MTELFFDPPSPHLAVGTVFIVAVMCLLSWIATAVSELATKQPDYNLRQRCRSASVMAAVVIACTYAGAIPFALLVSAVSAGCIKEFMSLVHVEETPAYRWIGRLSAIAFPAAAFLESSPALQEFDFSRSAMFQAAIPGSLPVTHSLHPFYILPVLVIMLTLVVPLLMQRYRGMSVRESFTIFGVLYFGWFLAHLVLVRNHSDGFGYAMLLCFTVVWNDVLAYGAGRLYGRTKMAPLISPKKTREGAAGGLLGSICAASLFRFLVPECTLWSALSIGVVVGVTAPLGDLIVSVVKRDVGVKDSSQLIPGHGGMLDRCGSFTFASPAFYYFARLIGLLN